MTLPVNDLQDLSLPQRLRTIADDGELRGYLSDSIAGWLRDAAAEIARLRAEADRGARPGEGPRPESTCVDSARDGSPVKGLLPDLDVLVSGERDWTRVVPLRVVYEACSVAASTMPLEGPQSAQDAMDGAGPTLVWLGEERIRREGLAAGEPDECAADGTVLRRAVGEEKKG